MNYKTTLRIIVTGLLFGFSITDASASLQKLDKIHLQLIQRRLELKVPQRVSTSSNEC
jgi:hypothetical protein